MKSIVFKVSNKEIVEKSIFYNRIEKIVSQLKDGEYDFVAKIHKENRNIDQNALMWLWFTCIEKECGESKMSVYQHYCKMFIPDNCTYYNDGRFDSGNTSKLKTHEFAYFLKNIQADAASELGIQLPTREDLHFEEFRMRYEQYNK